CDQLHLCLTFLLILVSPATASGQYHFDALTTDNGLPQNTVQTIRQTRDGYLWIATSDGLVRFDGVRFTVFNSGNTDVIESNRFYCLYEDDHGALWVATEDGGIIRYYEGKFRTVVPVNNLPYKLVLGMYKAPDGGVLVLTNGALIYLANGDSADFVPQVLD